jgi:hypothetical protein
MPCRRVHLPSRPRTSCAEGTSSRSCRRGIPLASAGAADEGGRAAATRSPGRDFTEPVALSSTAPANARRAHLAVALPTVPRRGFDLLALRARCPSNVERPTANNKSLVGRRACTLRELARRRSVETLRHLVNRYRSRQLYLQQDECRPLLVPVERVRLPVEFGERLLHLGQFGEEVLELERAIACHIPTTRETPPWIPDPVDRRWCDERVSAWQALRQKRGRSSPRPARASRRSSSRS